MAARQGTPTRIPRATFASMVGERIRSNVIDGVLPPGSQLNEVELAETFGVSRGPVREALQRLIQEGLLLSEPHRGVFVPVMSADDVDDIYLAREALETAAVRRITGTPRAGSAYKALDKAVRAMERLERMFTTVISETRRCLGMLTEAYDRRDDLVEEHRRICDMIRADDTKGAVAVLKKHFDDAVVTLKRQLGADAEGEQAG